MQNKNIFFGKKKSVEKILDSDCEIFWLFSFNDIKIIANITIFYYVAIN